MTCCTAEKLRLAVWATIGAAILAALLEPEGHISTIRRKHGAARARPERSE